MADNMNDTEIDSMLNAANKKLGNDTASEPEPAPAPKAGTGKLTQEDIERLLNMSNDTPDEADIPDDDEAEKASLEISPDAIVDDDEEDEEEYYDNDDDAEIASFLEASIIGEKATEIEYEDETTVQVKGEQTPKKKGFLSVIFTVLAVIVAGALGFCIALLCFTDFIKTSEEEFAIKAANTVNSCLDVNTELFIYKAYVKSGADSTECILYGMESFGGDNVIDMYRIVVKNDEPNKINVYHTLDESDPDYIAMKNSDDPEVRIQASMLKNYSDTIALADKEISIGAPEWKEVDCTIINANINSEQIKTNPVGVAS